jgi:hypothetical protein
MLEGQCNTDLFLAIAADSEPKVRQAVAAGAAVGAARNK